MKVKTLRRMLKKKGKKTTGKKATLLKRLHMRGGKMVMATDDDVTNGVKDKDGNLVVAGKNYDDGKLEEGGRRRRSRRRREEGGRRRSSRGHTRPMGVIF